MLATVKSNAFSRTKQDPKSKDGFLSKQVLETQQYI